jgi:glycine oxidase
VRRRVARGGGHAVNVAPEVVVVGGGVMGCASALALAREGVAVTVLERSVPGAEASSAAAGMLGAQVEARRDDAMFRLCLESRRRFPAWAAALREDTGIDVELRLSGILRVAATAEELSRLRAEAAFQLDGTLDARVVEAPGLAEIEPSVAPDLAGGLWFERDARVDPRILLRALRIAAERRGARFESGAMVKRVVIERDRATGVAFDDGRVLAAGHVVIAAGSWSSLVAGLPVPEGRVRPARGQIVQVRAPSPVLRTVVFGHDAYLCPRDDGRVLIGSTLEFVGFQRGVTAGAIARLLAAAIRLVPSLEGADFDSAWSSFRPYTDDELPLLGPSGVEGLSLATGHYRNGILLAPITGEIASRVARGLPPPVALEPFSALRFAPGSDAPEPT